MGRIGYSAITGAAFFHMLTIGTGAAHAESDPIQSMAALFGARPAVENLSLSPDGKHLAYIQPLSGQASVLFVTALDGGAAPQPILRSSGSPDRLSSCDWVANDRLLCEAIAVASLNVAEITYVSRLFALNSDGSNIRQITSPKGSGNRTEYDLFGGGVIDWLPSEDGKILMVRNYIPEETIGTRLAQSKSGLGVDKIDTRNLRATSVEPPKDSASNYITDGMGNVRIMALRERNVAGYDTGTTRYLYRLSDSRNWQELSTVDINDAGFRPVAVDAKANIAYGLKKLDGRFAAYSLSLDGLRTEHLVYSRPDVDVDGFKHIGRQQRVIGVSYTSDSGNAVYFDEPLKKLAQGLSKAMPNLPLIDFVAASQDEQVLVVSAGSDNDPGRYYSFDRTSRQLRELMLERPQLEGVTLARSKPVSYPARDGVSVPGYLTLPPGREAKGLPAIVLPHGGPSARDSWGFDWLSQYFASLGYAVLQPNFRGSSGYGDAWFRDNGFKSWRTAIGDVSDAGRWLIAQGIADPKRLSIVGWSYGGYAALQAAVVDPKLFQKVVAIAPVTDLEKVKEERRDWTDYKIVSDMIGTGPHVGEGSPARHASAIEAPVLMFHGTMDRNVLVSESKLMDDRLKDAGKRSELIVYDKLDHYLEDSAARTDMLARIGRFLQAP